MSWNLKDGYKNPLQSHFIPPVPVKTPVAPKRFEHEQVTDRLLCYLLSVLSAGFPDLFFCEASLTLPRCSSVSLIENAAWSLKGGRRGREKKRQKGKESRWHQPAIHSEQIYDLTHFSFSGCWHCAAAIQQQRRLKVHHGDTFNCLPSRCDI